MPSTPLKPRIVLVEDDPGRIEFFSRWLQATEFVLVTARPGGQALGLLGKGAEGVAGLMLDHDLSDSLLTSTDALLSASNLIPVIQRNVPRHVPVLIHSHNVSKPVTMERALVSAGFSVTRVRFATLLRDTSLFTNWLDDVRDDWEPERCLAHRQYASPQVTPGSWSAAGHATNRGANAAWMVSLAPRGAALAAVWTAWLAARSSCRHCATQSRLPYLSASACPCS